MRTVRPIASLSDCRLSSSAITSTGLARLVAAQAAHELQRVRDHGLHFLQVGLEALAQLLVVQQLGAQPHARDRRLQVVRHGRQHPGAVLDEARQAALHGVEGARGLPDLGRPFLGQRRAVDVPAQGFGRRGQHMQRPRHPAHRHVRQQQHRDQQDAQRQRQPPGQRGRGRRQLAVEARPAAVAQLDLGAQDGPPWPGPRPIHPGPPSAPGPPMRPGPPPIMTGVAARAVPAARRARRPKAGPGSTRSARSSPSDARSMAVNIAARGPASLRVGQRRPRRIVQRQDQRRHAAAPRRCARARPGPASRAA